MQRISFDNRVRPNELARLLHVHRNTVWNWIARGWLVARHRPDGTWIRLKAYKRALNNPHIRDVVAAASARYWKRQQRLLEGVAERQLGEEG